MVSTGMKDAGYEYLNIDDCWQVGRDNEGNILVDEKNFLPASRLWQITYTPKDLNLVFIHVRER